MYVLWCHLMQNFIISLYAVFGTMTLKGCHAWLSIVPGKGEVIVPRLPTNDWITFNFSSRSWIMDSWLSRMYGVDRYGHLNTFKWNGWHWNRYQWEAISDFANKLLMCFIWYSIFEIQNSYGNRLFIMLPLNTVRVVGIKKKHWNHKSLQLYYFFCNLNMYVYFFLFSQLKQAAHLFFYE